MIIALFLMMTYQKLINCFLSAIWVYVCFSVTNPRYKTFVYACALCPFRHIPVSNLKNHWYLLNSFTIFVIFCPRANIKIFAWQVNLGTPTINWSRKPSDCLKAYLPNQSAKNGPGLALRRPVNIFNKFTFSRIRNCP